MIKLIRRAHNEPIKSTAYRFFRSLIWFLKGPPVKGMNHYCHGDSGSGAWCFQSEAPCRCGYCGKPSKALRDE